jgi:hypothetical protein
MRNLQCLFVQEVTHTKLEEPTLLVAQVKMKATIIPSVPLHHACYIERGFVVYLLSLFHSKY